MTQGTSGRIACSDWLRRATCWSVIFRIVSFQKRSTHPLGYYKWFNKTWQQQSNLLNFCI